MIEIILIGVLFACVFAGLAKVAIDHHDAWQFRRWQKRRESMTLDERIASMNIRVD